MSVTDPLIKQIKGLTSKLLSFGEGITDSHPNLSEFCQTLQELFYQGSSHKFDGCSWMFSVIRDDNYPYRSGLERVKRYNSSLSPSGRFRLMVRHCLVKKCLHVPLDSLLKSNLVSVFYSRDSIIGDEILSAILLSVLLHCSKIEFKLDLENCAFLESSWQRPKRLTFELVPCRSLGVAVSFSENKAVIINIEAGGVVSEVTAITKGDILESLNGVLIDSGSKGKLQSILQAKKGQPIEITIIKGFDEETNTLFLPIKKLWNLLDIGSEGAHLGNSHELSPIAKVKQHDYKATYLGAMDVGSKGNVKLINSAIKQMVSGEAQSPQPVTFDIGEMNVKIVNSENNDVILKHSYMQISSCGSVPTLPHHIAYIAGEKNCDTASNFVCYVFYVQDIERAATLLKGIGQGFHRTHFAV